MNNKKIITTLIALLFCIPLHAYIDYGNCGENLTYSFDTDTKVLKIEGSGDMYDFGLCNEYTYENWIDVPWEFFLDNIRTIELPEGLTHIGTYAFYNCNQLSSIIIPNSVTSIGRCAFYYCTGLSYISLSDNLTSIEFETFIGCTNLKSITFPDNLKSIGSEAFWLCSSLATINFSKNLERIGGDAFNGCISLTKLVFPDKVSSIGSYAFAYCSGITSISIPISLTSIGECAFNSCSSLNEMICHCSNIPATGDYVFDGSGYADGVLYVPADAIIKYENAYPWYGWGEIKAIEEENALDVVLPDNGQKQYYTLDGNKSVTSSNGLYIIKNEDGSVQKVMVK